MPTEARGTGFAPVPQSWIEYIKSRRKYFAVALIMSFYDWNATADPAKAKLAIDEVPDLIAPLRRRGPKAAHRNIGQRRTAMSLAEHIARKGFSIRNPLQDKLRDYCGEVSNRSYPSAVL